MRADTGIYSDGELIVQNRSAGGHWDDTPAAKDGHRDMTAVAKGATVNQRAGNVVPWESESDGKEAAERSANRVEFTLLKTRKRNITGNSKQRMAVVDFEQQDEGFYGNILPTSS